MNMNKIDEDLLTNYANCFAIDEENVVDNIKCLNEVKKELSGIDLPEKIMDYLEKVDEIFLLSLASISCDFDLIYEGEGGEYCFYLTIEDDEILLDELSKETLADIKASLFEEILKLDILEKREHLSGNLRRTIIKKKLIKLKQLRYI
ncbi:hypothetical protein [Halanaerobacter jeridensis]|uniref:Uncharacterized protein n=1 Tax=Halanaerobacter jeridensis TaxID=706427 RepID=A0A939BT25_9FIRM|nr:hypothetical protein [Halanaerobacter jeridensis]MBM7557781.1 hypothetical protein [Halanaerobacter jeridensis]